MFHGSYGIWQPYVFSMVYVSLSQCTKSSNSFWRYFLGSILSIPIVVTEIPNFFTKASGRHLLPSALHHHLAGSQKLSGPLFFVAGEDAAGLATTTLVLPNLRDPDFLTLLMFLGRPRSRHWSGYVFSTNLGTSSHLNIYCGNISYVL